MTEGMERVVTTRFHVFSLFTSRKINRGAVAQFDARGLHIAPLLGFREACSTLVCPKMDIAPMTTFLESLPAKGIMTWHAAAVTGTRAAARTS